MSNMSYCRFRNTLIDLQDCYEALESSNEDQLCLEEIHAKLQLIALCKDITQDFGD